MGCGNVSDGTGIMRSGADLCGSRHLLSHARGRRRRAHHVEVTQQHQLPSSRDVRVVVLVGPSFFFRNPNDRAGGRNGPTGISWQGMATGSMKPSRPSVCLTTVAPHIVQYAIESCRGDIGCRGPLRSRAKTGAAREGGGGRAAARNTGQDNGPGPRSRATAPHGGEKERRDGAR